MAGVTISPNQYYLGGGGPDGGGIAAAYAEGAADTQRQDANRQALRVNEQLQRMREQQMRIEATKFGWEGDDRAKQIAAFDGLADVPRLTEYGGAAPATGPGQGIFSAPSVGTPALRPEAAPAASLIKNESGGKFDINNSVPGAGGFVGHFGRAQFGVARLQEAKAAGVIPQNMTPQQFQKDPQAQVAAETWHFNDISNYIAQRGLGKYVGYQINGVPVTMQGMLAVAHLGGKAGLEKFLTSAGKYNPADANGTRLSDYLQRHGGLEGAGATTPLMTRQNPQTPVGMPPIAGAGGMPSMIGLPMQFTTDAQATATANGQPAPEMTVEWVRSVWPQMTPEQKLRAFSYFDQQKDGVANPRFGDSTPPSAVAYERFRQLMEQPDPSTVAGGYSPGNVISVAGADGKPVEINLTGGTPDAIPPAAIQTRVGAADVAPAPGTPLDIAPAQQAPAATPAAPAQEAPAGAGLQQPGASVVQNTGAGATAAPNADYYIFEPVNIQRDAAILEQQRKIMQQHLRVAIATRDATRAPEINARIAQLDIGEQYLRGMHALTEFNAGRPSTMNQILQNITGKHMSIKPRPDGTYDVYNAGAKVREAIPPKELSLQFRKLFDQEYLKQAQAAQQRMIAQQDEQYKTSLKIWEKTAEEKAKTAGTLTVEEMKGWQQRLLEHYKRLHPAAEVQKAGEDGDFIVFIDGKPVRRVRLDVEINPVTGKPVLVPGPDGKPIPRKTAVEYPANTGLR